jgi:hypothetical protein
MIEFQTVCQVCMLEKDMNGRQCQLVEDKEDKDEENIFSF